MYIPEDILMALDQAWKVHLSPSSGSKKDKLLDRWKAHFKVDKHDKKSAKQQYNEHNFEKWAKALVTLW